MSSQQVCFHSAGRNRVIGAPVFMRFFAGGATALALVTSGAQAQTASPQPGSRVRLTRSCVDDPGEPQQPSRWCPVVGEFVRAQPGLLSIRVADSISRYGLESIRRFEVSRGFRSYKWIGAVAGFVAGAGVSFVILHSGGSTAPCDRSANQDAMNATECLGLVALGGLTGAGLGAIIGGVIRTERWDQVPLESLRVGFESGPSPAIVILGKLR
jgi:hypothetical protein